MHLQLLCSIFLCCNNINNNNITFTGRARQRRKIGEDGILRCERDACMRFITRAWKPRLGLGLGLGLDL